MSRPLSWQHLGFFCGREVSESSELAPSRRGWCLPSWGTTSLEKGPVWLSKVLLEVAWFPSGLSTAGFDTCADKGTNLSRTRQR